ncbi:MAG TPA: bifunctional 5,10-methylene-tetrahydrofolate dehydrogenase/5,10-methylene-tetrahydrofolate cyclohydrolase [Clostridiaceae bacterium]|nr:bifunctional 5,10-methylene-tetrahydrofolate dehydrogenase/5,10-methylene-tetrahydrofolate cyclohydrolase [Clostridiaceae bacterium]
MAVLLKGSEVVNAMKDKLLDSVEELRKQGIVPGLAIVRLGANPDDLSYERGIIKRCEGLGIKCSVHEFDEQITQCDLIREIGNLNNNEEVHGILIFRPLPRHIDENVVKHAISPEKDMDCLNPINVAKVFEGDTSGYAPCTPEAVVEILDHYGISVEGKKVVIIGRSLVVGRPLSMLLLKKNATVTICHTRTRNIEEVCKEAEILIAAAGKAKMVTGSFISEGQTVIDVGINVDENGKLCGDVDFDEAEKKAAYITPVPGGVGTVTTSILAKHVVQAAMKKRAKD